MLSLKTARRRLACTYIASHSIFYLKLCRSVTNQYFKFIFAAKKSYYSSLVHSPHPTLALFGKLSTRSYTELQIVPYPHHPLWLPYFSYSPPTFLIKSQSYISTYQITLLPPQLLLCHLHPSSTSLFHSCYLTRNWQSTISII